MPPATLYAPPDRKDRVFFGALLVLNFVIGLTGIYYYAYIGQDYDGLNGHPYHIYTWPETYSFGLTNPPGLFWFGHLLYQHVSPAHCMELLAFSFLVLNTAALGILYRLFWRSIGNRQLRYAAAVLLTCLPVRVIHSIVIAADGFTVPFFALIALLVLGLLENVRRVSAWVALSLTLSLSLACKYTFVGTMPAIAVLLALAIWRQAAGRQRWRWALTGVCALALPAVVFLGEMFTSSKSDGYTTAGYWLPKGADPVMRWRDILTVQRSDWQIFSAPQYFQDQLYGYRKYSYPALSHLATVTDSMNIRQHPPKEISTAWGQRYHDWILRSRTPRSQSLQAWAVRTSLPLTLLALVGMLSCLILSVPVLLRQKPWLSPAAVVLTALAVSYYAPVFFGLHRINDPYTAGYWLPRLVLPGLLVFYGLGFVLLDFAGMRLGRPAIFKVVSSAILAYTVAVCLLFLGFLT